MTISSSLNAGVAGLNANANRLSSIADNIANSATYGYKRSETDFYSVVVQGGTSKSYAAGGVRTSSARLIDERGPLVATRNSTDLAIDGRGFMAVTDLAAADSGTGPFPISLVTTGSFRADDAGILRTDAGQVLMGWPANPDGSSGVYPRDTMAGLVPVRLDSNQYVGNPTTKVVMGINLPATSTTSNATGDPETLTVEYFGNLGTSEALDVSFAPTIPASGSSNTWTMTITDAASGGAVVGEYTISFNNTQANGGTIASVTTLSGGAYDPATGKMDIAVAGGTISVEIGRPNSPNGMTQLANTFSPVGISKNGSTVATLT